LMPVLDEQLGDELARVLQVLDDNDPQHPHKATPWNRGVRPSRTQNFGCAV
jgi:hypothetical protein